MKKRDHKSAVAARTELVNAGFVTAHTVPGRPECWGKPGDAKRTRYGIAREDRDRCQKWHIVDYPGSPVVDLEFSYLECA